MNKEQIIKELGLKSNGAKGWLNSPEVVCEQCGKYDKTGILFLKEGGVVNCMRCGTSISIFKWLKSVNKQHLIGAVTYTPNLTRTLNSVSTDVETKETTPLPEKRLPVGFKPVFYDEYLEERGFLPHHYELFKPGITNIDPSQRDNVIFQIFDDRGVRVAWMSRSKKTKEWHKNNIEEFHNGTSHLNLRYDNSKNTNFSDIVGGMSEVTPETDTIILVEGLFDKVNVDRQLDLHLQKEVKCLFTFGDSVKPVQIDILKRINVSSVYLLYDYGTTINTKRYGLELKESLNGVDVFCCEIRKKDADPGDLTKLELLNTLLQSVDPMVFQLSKLNYVS